MFNYIQQKLGILISYYLNNFGKKEGTEYKKHGIKICKQLFDPPICHHICHLRANQMSTLDIMASQKGRYNPQSGAPSSTYYRVLLIFMY